MKTKVERFLNTDYNLYVMIREDLYITPLTLTYVYYRQNEIYNNLPYVGLCDFLEEQNSLHSKFAVCNREYNFYANYFNVFDFNSLYYNIL